MAGLLFKILGVFLIIYVLWLLTGGVERGEERRALDDDGIFIELRGTALDESATTSPVNFNIRR